MRRGAMTLLTVCALLLTAGCGGSSGPTGTRRSSSPSSQSGVASTEIAVAVHDGKVVPKAHRVEVAKGSAVRLLVTSDVDDEVHVHGYDLEQELSAGQTGTIEFTADQQGVFEVETHESGLLLLQLEVR